MNLQEVSEFFVATASFDDLVTWPLVKLVSRCIKATHNPHRILFTSRAQQSTALLIPHHNPHSHLDTQNHGLRNISYLPTYVAILNSVVAVVVAQLTKYLDRSAYEDGQQAQDCRRL